MTPTARAEAFRAASRHLREHGPNAVKPMLAALAEEADDAPRLPLPSTRPSK